MMYFRYSYLPVAAVIMLLLASCSETNKEPSDNEKSQAANTQAPLRLSIARIAPGESLLTFSAIPLGSSYADIKNVFPPSSPLSLEEEITGDTSLQQSIVPISLFGRNGKLEMNFKNKKLYSYYYSVPVQQAHWGDSVYNSLAAFYNGKYGKGNEENNTDDDNASRSYYWHAGAADIALTYSQLSSLLSWGVQQKQAELE